MDVKKEYNCFTLYNKLSRKPDELNLAALKLLKKFKINAGYSDHSEF